MLTLGELGRLVVLLGADSSELDQDLDKAQKKTNRFVGGLRATAAKGFGGLKKAVGAGLLGGVGLATAGIGALGVAFSDSISLAKQQRDAERQLDAVLKSTGGAAGMTAEELKALASSLQDVTNFGDEATIQGESLLLTFTNIGRDVFPRATETMLDMSQALGQDMKSSAIQLGKALNDPVAGVSALSRVGVSFTEQQKEQIKAMVEAGDVAGAQTVILDELAKEFGGSARAMADPAKQLSNSWGDLKETVGLALLPVLDDLAKRALPWVQNGITTVTNVVEGLTDDGWSLGDVIGFIAQKFGMAKDKSFQLTDSIDSVVGQVRSAWDWTKKLLKPVIDLAAKYVTWQDVLTTLGGVIAAIVLPAFFSIVAGIAPILAAGALLVAGVALIRRAWEEDWGGIRTTLTDFWENTGKSTLEKLWTWLREDLPKAIDKLKRVWEEQLLPTIKKVWKWIQDNLFPVFRELVDVWIAALKVELAAIGAVWRTALKPALTALWSFMRDKVIPMFGEGKESLGGITEAAKTLVEWLKKLKDWLGGVAEKLTSLKGPGDLLGLVPGLPGFASGTAFAPGGLALVGEQGPELVQLPRGSQVLDSGSTGRILNRGGDTINIVNNVTVNNEQDIALLTEKIMRQLRKKQADQVWLPAF